MDRRIDGDDGSAEVYALFSGALFASGMGMLWNCTPVTF